MSFTFFIFKGFVAQRFHNYMILKVLIVFDPKLNLFKSDAYIFMQQSLVSGILGTLLLLLGFIADQYF